jgi:hypothetical protein
MIQPGHQSRFAFKLLPLVLVIREGQLQRNGMAQAKIDPLINHTHTPFSQGLNHAIAALQNCVWGQQGCAGSGSFLIRGGHCFSRFLEGKNLGRQGMAYEFCFCQPRLVHLVSASGFDLYEGKVREVLTSRLIRHLENGEGLEVEGLEA